MVKTVMLKGHFCKDNPILICYFCDVRICLVGKADRSTCLIDNSGFPD